MVFIFFVLVCVLLVYAINSMLYRVQIGTLSFIMFYLQKEKWLTIFSVCLDVQLELEVFFAESLTENTV